MNLQLTILSNLESVLPQLMARTVLLANLRILGRTETLAEIDQALREVETRKQMIAVSSEDAPGGYRYKITEEGRVRLREAGQ